MISSRNVFNRWVELTVEEGNTKIKIDVREVEAESLIYELFNVIVDLNRILCGDDDRKTLFETLLKEYLSEYEISQLFSEDEENSGE